MKPAAPAPPVSPAMAPCSSCETAREAAAAKPGRSMPKPRPDIMSAKTIKP